VLITRLELENIKSYQKAEITFPPGTTAISGANGAGKTTLVEAIGFALFGALPYAHAQFVREGERTGTITVTFISDYDGRTYQAVRRCGSNTTWYIYDPQMGQRLVEQRADVIAWLRQHMRIENDLDLKDLFTNALGVPQGTFTADFLLSPAIRKQKFDALLQVEDYRCAADKLLDTRAYLNDRLRDEDVHIADLSRATQDLDAWRRELEQWHAADRAAEDELFQTQVALQAVSARRDALRQQQEEIARLDAICASARSAWDAAMQLATHATHKREEAERAVMIVTATQADYQRFRAAEQELRAARQQQEARGTIQHQLAACQRDLAAAQSEADAAAEQLRTAQNAAAQAAALTPLISEQEQLEQELRASESAQDRLRQVEKTLADLDREQRQLHTDLDHVDARIAAIAALADEAALLAERRQTVERLNRALATRAERTHRADVAHQELKDVALQEERARKKLAKAEADIAKLLQNRDRAAELPALEARLHQTRATVAGLRADIARHDQSRKQSAGGLCPFLSEPCLNIRAKGQTSLEDYFSRLIAQAQRELRPLESEEARLTEEVRQCSRIKAYVDRLGEYEEQRDQAREELTTAATRRAALEAELADLEAWLARYATIEQDLAAAQANYQRSDDAERQMRALPELERERQRIVEQLATRASRHAAAIAEQEELCATATRLPEVQQRLAALNDPRRRRAALMGIADQAPIASQKLERARARQRAAQEQMARAEAQLAPFAGLDERVAALEADLERCRPGYDTYLQHEHLAATYQEACREQTQAQERERQAHAAFDDAYAAWEAASRQFDPDELQRAEADWLRCNDNATRLTELRRGLRQRIEARAAEVAHAETLLTELAAAQRERSQIADLLGALQLFRETIKEAGPYIMRARLRQISAEANRIFGEIIGDRSAQLSWEEDYEIVLRQQGNARRFLQLSGGEQMSAALAVRLALLKTLSNLDIAFFDEPTQNMDELRRANLAAQIRRVRGFQQIIVISHDDTFEQGIDSIIRLRKENGYTRILDSDETDRDYRSLFNSLASTGNTAPAEVS